MEKDISLIWNARQAENGGKWEAVLIAPGISRSRPAFHWTDDILQAAQSLFEGADINAYEVDSKFFGHVPDNFENVKSLLIANKAGVVRNVRFSAGEGLIGEIEFAPKFAWIPETLKNNPDFLGLSIDARVSAQQTAEPIVPTAITSVSSVDIVTRPAAGGRFLRSIMSITTGEKEMKNRMIKILTETRPDLLAGKDTEKMTEDEIFVIAQQAMEKPEPKKSENTPAKQSAPAGITADDLKNAVAEVEKRAVCSRTLDRRLMESRLPELAKERIAKQFEGKVFEIADLDTAMKNEAEYLAKMSVPGFDIPDQRAKVGPGSLEKIQMAVDHMFGLKSDDIRAMQAMERLDFKPVFPDLAGRKPDDMQGISRIHGLGELYALLSGDSEVSGRFNRAAMSADLRAAQGLNSGSFSYILGNTMARRLVKDYTESGQQENLLISLTKAVKDFRTQEAINLGYFGMIPDVDPETEDYPEIASPTDEESKYSIGQKGGILSVTRKMIINDDISVLTRLVNRLGRKARYTHAYYVWQFFIGNANCSDGTAWFTSGHGNYATGALTHATALTAYKALANMTEKDSGHKIGWLPGAGMPTLIGPVALMETLEKIANEDSYYTSNDLTTKVPNPLKGKVSAAIIPMLSDATDWGMLMPVSAGDMVEMGYLNGRQEPEMFVADQPSNETVFTGDKIRYKIRHEYAGAVVDFRTGYKAVVA
jgi:hypothetical protein